MNESIFQEIEKCAKAVSIDLPADELSEFADDQQLDAAQLEAIHEVFQYLEQRSWNIKVATLLRLSRLPKKIPKTFDNFDFTQLHGREINKLKNLPTLSYLFRRKNLAFIGPQGVGKTHLAMAYGHACCMQGYKAYFIKATELNQKLTQARKYGRTGSVINGLVKPTCLIIDEMGRCVFDQENTRLFFDVIDRRYSKDGPNTTIFTSNKTPDQWREDFRDDDSLLCSLDRAFDEAIVFMIKGDSYRGRTLEKVALHAGKQKSVES